MHGQLQELLLHVTTVAHTHPVPKGPSSFLTTYNSLSTPYKLEQASALFPEQQFLLHIANFQSRLSSDRLRPEIRCTKGGRHALKKSAI